ncbi:MAG: conserved hypothetical protein [Arenicellales bacterium IbO2]|nr:MAG: conserved hypothetical protein [Arenicellales bacterium IbO2]
MDAMRGVLRKMKASSSPEGVAYQLPVGKKLLPLGRRIGAQLSLAFTGDIFCIACGNKTKKSFSRGYCFPCARTLAECDLCIMRPHTCHHHLGTCRDETWAASHCMQPHCVYLANSSGLKVGITRAANVPARWLDQGATQAVVLFTVKNRLHSGLLENELAKYLSDRTDWRKMLRGAPAPLDLRAEAKRLLAEAADGLAALKAQHPELEWRTENSAPLEFSYPVARYPEKIASLDFHKRAEIAGRLDGIKGQYLILDCGVINVRKFSGYEVIVQ